MKEAHFKAHPDWKWCQKSTGSTSTTPLKTEIECEGLNLDPDNTLNGNTLKEPLFM